MTPLFSIITPTLQRESLVACCKSVDAQTLGSWEHIVVADSTQENYTLYDILEIRNQNRLVMRSPHITNNWGNTQRHIAWEWATGLYLIYVDDDNLLAHCEALSDIAGLLESANYPQWAIFPILRHGHWFFNDPPGMCMTDTLNIVVKRGIGRWPDIPTREADGYLVEELKKEFPYAAFPQSRAIGIMEHSSNGV